jgi:excisionase family DNA binding protein
MTMQDATHDAFRCSEVEVPEKLSAFLTAGEVAERLRCSLRTVHEMTRQAEIPYRRVGRRCLFRCDELDAWENGAPLEIVELADGRRLVRVSPSS